MNRYVALRLLLLFDAAVLLLIGGALAVYPQGLIKAFQFPALDPHYYYTLGMWGSVMLTLAVGNVWCAGDLWGHRYWVRISMMRGILEALLSLGYLLSGMGTLRQTWLGLVMGLLIALGYGLLSPRERS